jgi:hypothetical protein
MPKHLLRPLLIIEYLLAVQVVFTLWSEVGGQYHLDLMFWPWKLGLVLVAAALVVAITACAFRSETSLPRLIWVYAVLLLATFAVAGVVTYYYHVNEPADDEQDTQQNQPALHQTRQEFWPRTIG